MSVGLALIVKNEEIHIPSTLSQFYLLVDRIVVVDGGSTDGTVEWCKRMGAEVFHRPFRNNFSDQRNFALSLLDTDWVYFHDADERLEPTLIDILPKMLTDAGQKELGMVGIVPESAAPYDCFGFPRKTFVDGRQTETYPDYSYRLFKNYCKYTGKVYENIVGDLNRVAIDKQSEASRFNLLHYKSSVMVAQQQEFYKSISEQEV
jgi:glycosyltransferase involved in cell wall biosynthesis